MLFRTREGQAGKCDLPSLAASKPLRIIISSRLYGMFTIQWHCRVLRKILPEPRTDGMDTLRGHEIADDEDDFGPADDAAIETPPLVGDDERRMQVRAYNYWASLLGDRRLPSIEEDRESGGEGKSEARRV